MNFACGAFFKINRYFWTKWSWTGWILWNSSFEAARFIFNCSDNARRALSSLRAWRLNSLLWMQFNQNFCGDNFLILKVWQGHPHHSITTPPPPPPPNTTTHTPSPPSSTWRFGPPSQSNSTPPPPLYSTHPNCASISERWAPAGYYRSQPLVRAIRQTLVGYVSYFLIKFQKKCNRSYWDFCHPKAERNLDSDAEEPKVPLNFRLLRHVDFHLFWDKDPKEKLAFFNCSIPLPFIGRVNYFLSH